MDADAKLYALFRHEICIANRHCALDIDGRAHRVHQAYKLDENAISGGVGDTPAIGRYRGINQLGSQRPDARERTFLIRASDDMLTERPRRMMSEKQILDLLPIACSTLQNWEREGLFPKSVSIGPNRKAWYADEVAAWQNNRKAA